MSLFSLYLVSSPRHPSFLPAIPTPHLFSRKRPVADADLPQPCSPGLQARGLACSSFSSQDGLASSFPRYSERTLRPKVSALPVRFRPCRKRSTLLFIEHGTRVTGHRSTFLHGPIPRNDLTSLESALTENAPITPLECAHPKTQDLKPFRMNTSEKRGRGYPIIVNQPSPPFWQQATISRATTNQRKAAASERILSTTRQSFAPSFEGPGL